MSNEDKLTEIISIRVSKSLKEMHDTLSDLDKHDLNMRIRVEIARKLHESKFDPKFYLGGV